MALGKGLAGFRVLAAALLVMAPGLAYGHALLLNPAPRTNNDDLTKSPPCGANTLVKGAPVAQFDAGATIRVGWRETVGHTGCYQLRLSSTGNDQNFTLITQVNDPAGPPMGQTMDFDASIKLPDGVTCQNCTLQLLQLMNGAPCSANQDPATSAQGVYYSCADIRIGNFNDAGPIAEAGPDPDPDDDAGGTSSSGGTTTTPTDGGGKTSSSSGSGATGSRNLRAGEGDDGCSVGFGATTGLSFFVSAGIAAMALLRRRKR
jgi:hypothetical protein